jgi:hypothetical protein
MNSAALARLTPLRMKVCLDRHRRPHPLTKEEKHRHGQPPVIVSGQIRKTDAPVLFDGVNTRLSAAAKEVLGRPLADLYEPVPPEVSAGEVEQ